MIKLLQTYWNRPMPQIDSREIVSRGLILLLIFSIFYFAIFNFNSSSSQIKRDIFEFFLVGFSLFLSWLIFWGTTTLLAQPQHRPRNRSLGYYSTCFIIIYTLMIFILFILKKSLHFSAEMEIWPYYLRHFPYACLIFCVYLYRENKKYQIERLVAKANKIMENHRTRSQNQSHEQSEKPLMMQADGSYHKIYPSTISHISVDGHYLDIYYFNEKEPECLMVRKPLSQMTEELPSPPFYRVHRSHIVNLLYASKIGKSSNNYSISLSVNDYTLPISRSYLETVLSAFKSIH